MGFNYLKREKNTVKFELTIPAEPFAKECEKVFQKQKSRITVQGFRKGKAPRAVIERAYGKDIFFEDAINHLLEEYYKEADEGLEAQGVKPVFRPKIAIKTASVEDGAVLECEVIVEPKVKLGKYTGLKAEKIDNAPTDEDIDHEIEHMREKNARITTANRAAQMGDVAVIDFKGFIDDEPFEGGEAENYELTLGSGTFIPGYEEQIVGHSAGEEFDVNVTFPSDYIPEKYAGKTAVFKIKLHEVKARELPELDDEFAQDVSEFDTLAELKADLKKRATETAEHNQKIAMQDDLIEQIIKEMEVDLPGEMVVNRLYEMIDAQEAEYRKYGISFSEQLQKTPGGVDRFMAENHEIAEKQVLANLALAEIIKLEKIEANADEIEAEYARIAKERKAEVEKLKEFIQEEVIAHDVKVKKAIDYIIKEADIKKGGKK